MRLFLILTAALLATPALAAPPTARVSGNIAVRTGPGINYASLGNLTDGSRVTLDYCTRDDKWCFVTDTGWVNASYLIGWSAKIPVTPFTFQGGIFSNDDRRDNHGERRF